MERANCINIKATSLVRGRRASSLFPKLLHRLQDIKLALLKTYLHLELNNFKLEKQSPISKLKYAAG